MEPRNHPFAATFSRFKRSGRMERYGRITAITLASLAITACTTPSYVSPVEVTRFVGDAPAALGQGDIGIVAAPGLDPDSLEFQLYRDALSRELERQGYNVVTSNPEQIARLDITQTIAQAESRGSGVGVGVGGSTGSYGSGVGVGVGLDLTQLLSGPAPDEISRVVSVAIRLPGPRDNLWEGRAGFSASSNSEYADPALAADRAISALFSGFPGESGETIEID